MHKKQSERSLLSRRKLILGTVAGGVVTVAGGVWFSIEANEEPLTIDVALNKLNELMSEKLITNGVWNLPQILLHCAQSVEYSMLGFPQHKSELFKGTIGQGAFSLFSSKGRMLHNLSEVIPGAPTIESHSGFTQAAERFKKSLIDFKNYQGDLAPHFAYGELSRTQYEAAHVMHFNNHLAEVINV